MLYFQIRFDFGCLITIAYQLLNHSNQIFIVVLQVVSFQNVLTLTKNICFIIALYLRTLLGIYWTVQIIYVSRINKSN